MATLAWQFGLLPPLAGAGCDPALAWGPDCEREMARQTDLWNALVAIENERRAGERRVLTAGDPRLAALWDRFDAVLAALDALPRRPHNRMSDQGREDWRATVAGLRAERHQSWATLKPLIAAARRNQREALKGLSDTRYAAVKAARNNSGLWWGNYNAVCAAFEIALGRLAGGSRLQPHQSDGGGRLTNQLMGGFPAAQLTTGGHAQLWITEMPAGHPLLRRGAGRKGRLKLLVATVYSQGRATRRLAAWPIVLHRPFPEDAVVKTVAIHRRRVGARLDPLPGRRGNPFDWRWTATFACTVPDPPAAASNAACGIDIGWRLVEEGVRVATLVDGAGALEHIVVPRAWLDHRARLAELQGRARRAADAATTDVETIEARRLRQAATHGVDEADAERRQQYRVVAKEIARRYGVIAIDGTGIARLAQRKRAADTGEDLPPATRRMRTWSAPGMLMNEIERAARAVGGRVEIVGGVSTVVCHVCGYTTRPADRAELVWLCEQGHAWDQDVNAARNVLAALDGRVRPRPGIASGPAPLTVAPRQNNGLRRARGDRKASARTPPAKPLAPLAL